MFDHEGYDRTVQLPWQHCVLEEIYTGETHIIKEETTLKLHFDKDECKCFIRIEKKISICSDDNDDHEPTENE